MSLATRPTLHIAGVYPTGVRIEISGEGYPLTEDLSGRGPWAHAARIHNTEHWYVDMIGADHNELATQVSRWLEHRHSLHEQLAREKLTHGEDRGLSYQNRCYYARHGGKAQPHREYNAVVNAPCCPHCSADLFGARRRACYNEPMTACHACKSNIF